MTVVSACKFSRNHGAIVSDERGSDADDKNYDIYQKLYELKAGKKLFLIIGWCCSDGDLIYDATIQAHDAVKKKQAAISDGRSLLNGVAKVLMDAKQVAVDRYLKSKFGLEHKYFQMGKFPGENGALSDIDESFFELYKIDRKSGKLKEILDSEALVLVQDKTLNLFHITEHTHPRLVESRYECVGSGAPEADSVMYAFFKTMSRDTWDRINPLRGLGALVNSVGTACDRINSVGGTPYIKIVKNGQIITPSEENSHLASEIVAGGAQRHLPQSFVDKAIDDLLYNAADSQTVEDEMWKRAKNVRTFSRFLRDYRV
ncbi:hypothetical protein J4219_07595 [Candidatus Woesearchaeota archaeon]|nr:hypothetical protein [Candidatus Woesearchaeota archaeon]